MLLYTFEKFKNCNINDINPEIIIIIKKPINGNNGTQDKIDTEW